MGSFGIFGVGSLEFLSCAAVMALWTSGLARLAACCFSEMGDSGNKVVLPISGIAWGGVEF